jgi:hypothetical protein
VATYASTAELDAYAEEIGVSGTDLDREGMVKRAERDLDGSLFAPLAVLPSGLRYDPASLTAAQRTALSRATCAQALFRNDAGEADTMLGGDDYVPAELRVVRTAGRISPQALSELAGTGLIAYAGCAAPTPPA